MRRSITGFERDESGDWVAALSCLHGQHVRHRPPFLLAAWVEDDEQRQARIGHHLDCPLCDRAELPAGLRIVRTTPTWDRTSTPPALLATHRVAGGTWGLLRVESGALRFRIEGPPGWTAMVDAAHPQPIPPEMDHHIEHVGDVRFAITFLTR